MNLMLSDELYEVWSSYPNVIWQAYSHQNGMEVNVIAAKTNQVSRGKHKQLLWSKQILALLYDLIFNCNLYSFIK